MSITAALNAVMQEVGAVGKDGQVRPAQGRQGPSFNFRGIDHVVNAVSPALRKHGVVVHPTVLDYKYEQATTSGGKPTGHVIVTVSYTFTHTSGESLTATVIGESMDSGDKAAPKAMSVAFRTALLQVLCLPTDEKDPDEHIYERAPVKARQEAPVAATEPAVVGEWAQMLADATTTAEVQAIADQMRAAGAPDNLLEAARTRWAEVA